MRERSPESLRPHKLRKKKTVAMVGAVDEAFFLLVMSLVFLGIGLVRAKTEKFSDTWPLFVMASLRSVGSPVFIPGGYFTFVFIMILLRVEGFSYEMLPDNE